MESINVDINIKGDQFSHLAESIKDEIIDELVDDLEDRIKDYVQENIDVSDDISQWIDYNLDIDDRIESWIDSNLDIEDRLINLLSSYNPERACSTGESFTDAVSRAIQFLFTDQYFVKSIISNMDRAKFADQFEQEKLNIIEEAKPEIIKEFVSEIEKYQKDLDLIKAKEILGVNESNGISITNPIDETYGYTA